MKPSHGPQEALTRTTRSPHTDHTKPSHGPQEALTWTTGFPPLRRHTLARARATITCMSSRRSAALRFRALPVSPPEGASWSSTSSSWYTQESAQRPCPRTHKSQLNVLVARRSQGCLRVLGACLFVVVVFPVSCLVYMHCVLSCVHPRESAPDAPPRSGQEGCRT